MNLKEQVARAALSEIINLDCTIIGVGTGTTVNCFIEELATLKSRIDGCIASSQATETYLRALGIPVIELNTVSKVPIYIDGADEINVARELLKGGGGALTREKIIASASNKFICIADESKMVKRLGAFPVAIEVIPMARSFVAREIIKLGGSPQYREGFITDNGNIILDIYNLDIMVPLMMENKINSISGVVENGIFAQRIADKVLLASKSGITSF